MCPINLINKDKNIYINQEASFKISFKAHFQ